MSSNEIWVVIVLGLVGYWVTAALIKFFKKESDWTSKQAQEAYEDQNANHHQPNREDDSIQAWYEVLGVSSDASIEEIKVAYKKKVSMYHPDKVSNMGPEFNVIAERKTKAINAAYDEALSLKK